MWMIVLGEFQSRCFGETQTIEPPQSGKNEMDELFF